MTGADPRRAAAAEAVPALDRETPLPRPERGPGAPPQYAGRVLLGMGLALAGLLAGWAAYALDWKVVLGLVVGLVIAVTAALRPTVGCVFLVVALPLLDLVPPRLAGIKALNPLNLMLLVVGASWIVNSLLRRQRLLPRNGLTVPLLVFAAVLISSIALTVHELPADHVGRAVDDLKLCVTSFAPFFLAAGILRTEKQRRDVLRALVIMVVFVALRALVSYGLDLAGGASASRLRITGFLEQPNEFAGFLAVNIPLLLVLGFSERQPGWRLFLLLGGAACVFVLLLTQSRGGILALGLALLAVGVLRERRLLLAFVLALLLAPLWVPSTVHQRFSSTRVTSEETGERRLDDSSEARLGVWARGLDLYRSSPLLGHGFGTFAYALRATGYKGEVVAPHSTFVRTLAENGTVGMAGLLWLLFALGRLALKRGGADACGATRLRHGLLGGVLAFIVVNAFGTRFYNIQETGYFWVLAGLVAACGWATRMAPAVAAAPRPDQARG